MSSSHDVGNIAALREACQKMRDLLMLRGNGKTRCILTWDEFNEAQLNLQDALSAPPRNCDVGTAEEQTARIRKLCTKFKPSCIGCPCYGDIHRVNCWLAWAQMPYEAKEGEGK